MKVDRNREAQNYLGLLNQKSFVCEVYELAWQNQQEVLCALEVFLQSYPEKRICIVWDNARWHKGKELRKQLKHGQQLERINLINLPPYAPDQNPQEHVWKYGKEHISNQTFNSFEQMTRLFEKTLNRSFDYKLSKFILR